jgi:hypothetical protein
MVALMDRSIDLLEELAVESDNVFRLNRRGYLFATAEPARVATFMGAAEEAAALGAGPGRVHATPSDDYRPSAFEGFERTLRGTDLITEPSLIRRHYPWLAPDTIALLHAGAAGGSAASSSACTCWSRRALTASASSRDESSASTRRAGACEEWR